MTRAEALDLVERALHQVGYVPDNAGKILAALREPEALSAEDKIDAGGAMRYGARLGGRPYMPDVEWNAGDAFDELADRGFAIVRVTR